MSKTLKTYDSLIKMINELELQNKRYREDIKKVLNRERSDILYTQKEALRDIGKILEGDPHESS